MPLDDNVTTASFELNNALNVSRIVDEHRPPDPRVAQPAGFLRPAELSRAAAERQAEHSDLHLRRPPDRHRRFAGLRHQVRRDPQRLCLPDVSGALVSGQRLHRRPLHGRPADHRSDRLSRDGERHRDAPTRRPATRPPTRSSYTQPSFPGSIAVVQGDPVKVTSQGVTTTLYFRDKQERWRKPTAKRPAR